MGNKKNGRPRGPLTPKRTVRLAPLPESTQLFGFRGGDGREVIPNYDDAVCLCTEVIASDVDELAGKGVVATVGQFVISAGGCSALEFFGPFSTIDDALRFAQGKFGAETWKSAPVGF